MEYIYCAIFNSKYFIPKKNTHPKRLVHTAMCTYLSNNNNLSSAVPGVDTFGDLVTYMDPTVKYVVRETAVHRKRYGRHTQQQRQQRQQRYDIMVDIYADFHA